MCYEISLSFYANERARISFRKPLKFKVIVYEHLNKIELDFGNEFINYSLIDSTDLNRLINLFINELLDMDEKYIKDMKIDITWL
jgi:hypothetical protein